METETISNYEKEKSTEQLGLEKHDDIKNSANLDDTIMNHMNNGHEIESAQDKDDLDDSRSDEEEEDVPLIVQGSKSDEERSDDELSHLDLHNDDDDEDGEELVESATQKQEDSNMLNSSQEYQEVSSSGANEPILANEANTENISYELTNGDKDISDEKLDQSDDTEIKKTDAGKNEDIEDRQELQDDIKDNETHKEEPRDLEYITADKNELDNDNHKTNQVNDIQNVKDSVSNNKDNLLKTTELDQSTNNKNDLEGQECDGNQNKTEAQEKSKSSEVVEDECDNKEVDDKDKEVDKDKEYDTDKDDIAKALLEGDKDKKCDTGKEEDIAKDKEGYKDKECDTGKEEDVATNKNVDAVGDNNKVEQAVEDKSSDGGALAEEAKESDKDKEADKNKEGGEQDSLLKQTLSRPAEYKEPDEEDIEMDDDFDPSLLCPDIAMEVDEAPVITNSTELPPTDGTGSSALYEQTFSTAVDEFTGAEDSILLTPEEENLRIETFSNSPVQFTKIHCTACNVHLGSALDGQGNRFVHPLLKVLICKNCYHFYTSGEFEKDEDGSELYCRWCGQGGQVMCCSNCEMVFCKKCIRINFDRKTIAQIRDSEEWICFRCNPSQITYLKIHCAEFMEYVRRETSRASTLDNAVEFMKVDHTRCCSTQKKKATEQGSEVPKKRKRKTSVDPDFDPHRECDSPQPSTSGIQKNETITVTPKPTDPNKNGGVVKVSTPGFVKVTPSTSNTTPYRPRFYGPRPRVQVPSTSGGQSPRPTNSTSPGYIKIVPRAPTTTTTSTRNRAPAYIRPANNKPGTSMKHEWFERTVIAAARVNSNLSYTLTQLNRAQANATSVELLAVVHNKLQEILSSSINSLISIRKKLRLEFIEGIKNTRFPTTNKPQTIVPKPTTKNSTDDDDVIFVDHSASSTSTTGASTSATTNNRTSNVIANMSTPPPLAPIKKTTGILNTNERSNSPAATNAKVNDGQPKSFLRVKSLNALLNVSSECITIPDDSPATILTPVGSTTSTAVDDDDDDVKIIEKPIEHVDLTDSEHEEETKKSKETKETTFDLTSSPSNGTSRMKIAYVKIKRSLKMEELIKQEYGNSSIEGNSNVDGNSNVAKNSNVSDNSNVEGNSKADENINDVTE